MPDTHHYILGTAGHIDHGKSSLVKALTGTDPDRLPEEKARGMTIDLGFANLTLPANDSSGDQLSIGVVDVPGHADFVKNMVAGVGSIDLALFVVAADDGWMPQTEEHYQILNYLRVPKALVALTKTDLVDDLELVLDDIRENLAGGPWENIPVIPTSAQTGDGIDDLRKSISDTLTQSPPANDCGKPRLPVDRAFSLKGIGTVVTGTLIDGSITAGTDLVVQPAGLKAHIRTVQSHHENENTAAPGTRTALNLTGISVAQKNTDGVARGNVITDPALGSPVTAIDVLLEKSDREIRGHPNATRPLKTGRQATFHYGSASYPARLHFLGTKSLEPGQSTLAEIRFKDPVFVFICDHFVLRDASQGFTIAGGTVLDEDANRRVFRKPWQKEFLEARAKAPHDLPTLLLSQLHRDKALPRSSLLPKSRFSTSQINDASFRLLESGQLAESGSWLFDGTWWNQISGKAAHLIHDFHKANPDLPGLPAPDLRHAVAEELPHEKLFDTLLDGLLAGDFTKAGPAIRHRDHAPELPAELKNAGEKIRQLLAADPIAPPNKREVAPGPAEEKALRFLIHIGDVVELNPKTVISTDGYEKIKTDVTAFLQENKKATASELRKITGTSRRILLPVLERFDAGGITVREEDYRSLKK